MYVLYVYYAHIMDMTEFTLKRRKVGKYETEAVTFRVQSSLRKALRDRGILMTQAAEMGVALAVAGVTAVKITPSGVKLIFGDDDQDQNTHTDANHKDHKDEANQGSIPDSTSGKPRSRRGRGNGTRKSRRTNRASDA